MANNLAIRESKKRFKRSVAGKRAAKKYQQSSKGKLVYKFIWLKHKYGISKADYNEMFQKQGGCCAICGKHQSECYHPLGVDHNHLTSKIRGLLCGPCNSALSFLKVDEFGKEYLVQAIRYIQNEFQSSTLFNNKIDYVGDDPDEPPDDGIDF